MKKIKRIISVILVVSMLFTTNGISVFADSIGEAKTTSLPHKYLVPSNNQSGEGIDAEKGIVADGENNNEDESNLGENPNEGENNSSNNSQNENEETTTVESTTIEESTVESSGESETTSTTETNIESSESTSETNASESSEESTSDTSSITATTVNKEVVEEEKTATTSDAEENIIENEITFELATLSETKVTNLFGTDEASESETSLIHGYFDDNDKYLNYIDDNYEAPIADMNRSGLFGADPLPSKYDAREKTNATTGLSYVPPIRFQNPYGTCWAFSSIGMIETSIRKKGYVSTEAASNLSELAFAYFVYNLEHVTNRSDYDNLCISGHDYYYLNQEYFTDPDEATWSQCGGSLVNSTKMMSTYLGAVVEDSLTEYSNDGNRNQAMLDIENHGLPAEYAYKKNAFVPKDIIYINKSNEEAIKQAIMDNGSVGFSYYAESNYEKNPSTGSIEFKARAFHWEGDGDNKKSYYMSNGQTRTNHAIMIVGWDDTIPKEKFYYGGADPVEDGIDYVHWQYNYRKSPTNEEYASATRKASRNGAWICRNSWSDSPVYLANGYFYISYDETSLSSTFYSVDAIPADTYKYNYHYDTTGADYTIAPYGDNTQYANVFKVSGEDDSQILQAVNIGVNTAGATYDIKIYTKSDGSPMAHPKDGTLATTKRCSNEFAGFYTFELDDEVVLAKDSYYSIVVEPMRLFVDMTDDYYGYFYTYNETKLGQSFFNNKSYSEDDWDDLNDPEFQSYITYYPAKEIDGKLYGSNWRIKGLANPDNTIPAPAEGYYVFVKDWFDGSTPGIQKNEVESITFLRNRDVVPSGADVTEWDLPSASHGLKGYTKGNDIYIYAPANVPIKLPADSSYLFSGNFNKIDFVDTAHLTIRDISMAMPTPVSGPKITFENLNSIVGLNKLNTEDVTDMQGMFYGCDTLSVVDFSSFNTSNVTDMSLMFSDCFDDDVKYLDLSSFNTSNVTSFNQMFNSTGAKEVNVSSFDTSSALSMAGMFCNFKNALNEDKGLIKLDLSNFNTRNVVTMIHMISAYNVASVSVANFDTRNVKSFEGLFYNMPKLTSVDISSFDTTSANDMRWMFAESSNLKTIIASASFVAKGNTTNMFNQCDSLVGGQGTPYSSDHVDGEYARIDQGPTSSAPGYFSEQPEVEYTLPQNWFNETKAGKTKEQITNITISKYPTQAPTSYNEKWNIDNSNGLVAYVVGTQVTIHAPEKGIIYLPADSSNMFSWFRNTQHIYNLNNLNTSRVTNMQSMFEQCQNLETVDISSFDTSNVTNMSNMFYYCRYTESINLGSIDTSNVTDFNHMFFFCTYLETLNITGFNTSSATDMSSMFSDCAALTSLNLSNFNTSNVTDMGSMFSGCQSMINIDLTSFDTRQVTNISKMFYCLNKNVSLTKTIDLSSFDTSNVTSMAQMFYRCTSLETIKVSEKFVTTKLTDSYSDLYMFEDCTSIKGGNNTLYDANHVDKLYARIDGLNGLPGYFTGADMVTVTFDLNGKGDNYTRMFARGSAITEPTAPTYTGYNFVHWYAEGTSDTTPYDFTQVLPTDAPATKRLIAKWNPISYKIYYKNVDGSSITDGEYVTKTYGSTVTLNTTPTKTGYVFVGWFTDDVSFNNSYDGTTDIASTEGDDKNIYAKWTANQYQVNYNLSGIAATEPSTPVTKTYGQALSAGTLKDPTNIPTGYTFAGWYKESTFANEWTGSDDLTTGTTAQTIYARWKAKITYNANGHGTAPAEVDVLLNTTTILPSIADVTGYTFDTTNSWYGEAGCTTLIGAASSNYTVTAPKELFAKWNEEEYSITYDKKDGNWTGTAPASTRKYSEEVTLPVAADIAKNDGVNDYVFKGWYTEDGSSSTWDETKKVTKINANTVAPAGGHVFYARWNPAWKITFNMLGHATAPSDIVAEQGTKVPTADIPANPSDTGFIFSGWYKNYDSTLADFDSRYTNPFNFSTDTVTANMTLYAKWKPISYTIRYNANGGTVSPSTDTKKYDENLTLAVPTRDGYDFDAWYQNYDSSTKTFSNLYNGTTNISTTDGDTKDIYAKWTPHQYTVDYDLVGVAATKPASTILKTYDEALADGVLQNPTNIPSGYEFLGWFKSYDSTTGNYGDQWTGSDDLTTGTTTQMIYAKWKRAIVYNVLMNGVDIGASAVPSKEITGETTYQLPNATATGYVFGGWYREAECTNFVGTYNDDVTVSAPTTFYAKWTPVQYKIYYKNVDGSSITDGEYVTKTYGSTVTLNTTPTKTGYVFVGWFTDDVSFNNSYDGTTDIASTEGDDKNIYAKWTANQYQVNYNLSGIAATEPSTPVTKTYGQALSAGTLKDPTNIPTGYTFAGWYKESTFANEWTGSDDLTTGTTAQTIYARWKAKITYNANGHGTAPAEVDVLLNTTTILPSIADVTGYTFDTTNSWYGEAGCTTLIGAASSNYTVTAPKELFAKWNEEEYSITYDKKDGNWTGTAPASTRKYSEEVTLPVAADISKNDGVNDYIFKGWYTVDGSSTTWDETKKVTKINVNTVAPAGGHVFYARWNPAWKITFNMLGHATAPSDIVAEQGTKVPTADIPANPSETGYIFSGWYKNYDGAVADFDSRYTNPFNFSTDTVTANMTLYAKWKPISYTIRYNANGGTVSPTSDTKVYDANLTLAVPTRTGYDFDAWYQNYDSTTDTFTNPYDGTTNISTTNGDTKDVYAKWIAHQYTVDYNLSGVAGAVAPTSTITKTYGKDLTAGELQNPSVIPSGYEFLGWFKEATFDNQWTGNDDLTSDNGVTVYIYAKWKRAVVFSVLYNGNDIGATVPPSIEITGPTDINLPSTSATGYVFGGWYRESELTNPVPDPVNVTDPTTFYAKWTPIEYDITYNALGGSLPGATTNPFTKTYGVAATLVDPTYEGYDFAGWYSSYNSTTKAYSNPYDGSTDISTDTTGKTIYAKWNPHKYNINYELSGHATAMTPYEKTYGVSYTPPTPTGIAEGYKFDGWFKESTFTNAYTGDDLTTGTTAQTIYARWKATVTYDANGHGTAPAAVDVILGQSTLLPSIANVTGYTFDTTNSWYDGSDTSTATLIGAAGGNYTVNAPKKMYAKWNENEHTITYNKDGGDWVAYDPVTAGVTTRKYSEERILPGALKIAKTGYTFLGWYKEGDTTKTVITKINANTDEDITVVAKWSENTYNITLNRNNGNYVSGYTAPSSRKYTESKTLPTNDDIKKTGYRLDGWYEQSDYSGSAVLEVAANTDAHKTFYAKWVPESYAVTLHENGGTINSGNVTSYTYGTGTPLPTDVTKANSVFKGWWTLDGTTSGTWGSEVTSISATETGIKDYYARWAESYVVTFNLVSGTTHPELANITNVPTSQNIESGNVAVRPQVNPQAENYEFVGWYDDTLTNAFNFSTPITAATTIYAKWNSVATYEVTFDLVSGTTSHPALGDITDIPDAQHIVNGRTVTKPADPTATGYRFVAWYTDDTFATEWNFTSNTITEPKTIYGKWSEVSYNIIYHENGGTYIDGYPKPTTRLYTESKTLPSNAEISKHGYTFGGWYESDIYEGSAITEVAANTARDVTVYAKWTPTANTKIITFNDNYSGATAEQAFILGEDSSIRTNVFTRSGYTFIRWKDSAGNVYLNTNQLTGDIVLYAEWQKNPTPPSSNDNGNSSSNSSSDSGSSRGAGPIPQNQQPQQQPTNQQGTAQQVEVPTSKSEQIVVSGNTASWSYDPVNNSWKLSALDLGGVPRNAVNGFFILSQVAVVIENNQAVAKTVSDTYYFDQQGNMVTGWVKTNDSKWYFFNNEKTLDEGKLCIGWKKIDGAWYFFSSTDGSMATNTTTSDGYKVGADGKWIQ